MKFVTPRLPLAASLAVAPEVQRQREWPTRVIQRMQSTMQDRLMVRALRSTRPATVPWQLKLFLRIPFVRDIPAKLIAFGPRRVRLRETERP
jgi:hypothetical protein